MKMDVIVLQCTSPKCIIGTGEREERCKVTTTSASNIHIGKVFRRHCFFAIPSSARGIRTVDYEVIWRED